MIVTWIDQRNKAFFQPLLQTEPGEGLAAFGLCIGELACGAAVFALHGSAAALVEAFVAEDCRRIGGGSFLVREAGRYLAAAGVRRLECDCSFRDWDRDFYIRPFLTACGFHGGERQGSDYLVPLETLCASSLFRQGDAKGTVLPMAELPEAVWAALPRLVRGTPYAGGVCLAAARGTLDAQVSMVALQKTGLTGYAVVERLGEKTVSLSYLYASEEKLLLAKLLRAALAEAAKRYPPETEVLLRVTEEHLGKLLQAVLKSGRWEEKPLYHFYREE